MPFDFHFEKKLKNLRAQRLYQEYGAVKRVNGPIVEGTLPGATVGGMCRLTAADQSKIEAEIVGFRDKYALLMPLDPAEGLSMNALIEQIDDKVLINVGDWMIGKLLDGRGRPVDISQMDLSKSEQRPIHNQVLKPTERAIIKEKIKTGVRAIDYTCTIGQGQRIAIMAGSGVGKSVSMGMIARNSQADINVIALIGERGREVSEFIERDLGEEGLKKSIVIAVSSDESPVLRTRGAQVATTIAEYFRDQGKNVMLMMDSVTRYAMALREIGLAAGEPPTAKGYTPSVFSSLPKLLERAGSKKGAGSITGIYTVLVDGEDFEDPIADAVRAIVDGHIVLTRKIAQQNRYPAIDVLQSLSRLAHIVNSEHEQDLNSKLRSLLAYYAEAEDLINIGAYRRGANENWDKAVVAYPQIVEFLKQKVNEDYSEEEAVKVLEEITNV